MHAWQIREETRRTKRHTPNSNMQMAFIAEQFNEPNTDFIIKNFNVAKGKDNFCKK